MYVEQDLYNELLKLGNTAMKLRTEIRKRPVNKASDNGLVVMERERMAERACDVLLNFCCKLDDLLK